MKSIIVSLLSLFGSIGLYAQTAEDYLQKGEVALSEGYYEDSKAFLESAAELGSSRACGLLAMGYMTSIYSNERDLRNALQWASKGVSQGDAICAGVIGIIKFNTSENIQQRLESLDALLYAYNNDFQLSYVGILISVCYILRGDEEQARKWAGKILKKDEDNEKKDDYYMAMALIAYLSLCEKDYVSAVTIAFDAMKEGNPLALYVAGRVQIQQNLYPSIGKQNVEKAVSYNYGFWDIAVFKDEINDYYSSIKDKTFD